MLVGIITGTYSTVFIAAAIAIILSRKSAEPGRGAPPQVQREARVITFDVDVAWLRRSFVTGFFVTVPLVVSVVAIVWPFRFADRLTSGLGERLIGAHVPGLGLVTTR